MLLNILQKLFVSFILSDGEKEDEGSIASNENGHQGAPVPETCIETTVPKQGQNLWYAYYSFKYLQRVNPHNICLCLVMGLKYFRGVIIF